MGPPFFFLLPMLLFWGLPIFFIARWAIRVRKALENRAPPAELPDRQQMERLLERVDGLADDLERLKERQDFVERLLEAPRRPAVSPPAARGDPGVPGDRGGSGEAGVA